MCGRKTLDLLHHRTYDWNVGRLGLQERIGMAYYRELRLDELVTWLLEKNPVVRLTDAEALQLATALLDKFDMLTYSKTAQ